MLLRTLQTRVHFPNVKIQECGLAYVKYILTCQLSGLPGLAWPATWVMQRTLNEHEQDLPVVTESLVIEDPAMKQPSAANVITQ